MATQGERLEALEKENGELKATVAGLTDRLSDVERILKDFEKLSETVAKHEATLAEGTAQLMDGEHPARGIVGDDVRGELLKAFRQIEAIANHINVRLPS